MINQNPEQIAQDHWMIQDIKKVNLHIGTDVSIRKYQTEIVTASLDTIEKYMYSYIYTNVMGQQ
jgi:hypothetical protein